MIVLIYIIVGILAVLSTWELFAALQRQALPKGRRANPSSFQKQKIFKKIRTKKKFSIILLMGGFLISALWFWSWWLLFMDGQDPFANQLLKVSFVGFAVFALAYFLTMKCPFCSSRAEPYAIFCDACGVPFSAASEKKGTGTLSKDKLDRILKTWSKKRVYARFLTALAWSTLILGFVFGKPAFTICLIIGLFFLFVSHIGMDRCPNCHSFVGRGYGKYVVLTTQYCQKCGLQLG